MSGGVLLDTSAWFAALSVREGRHREAVAAYETALASDTTLVTTNLILGEMQILVGRMFGAMAAVGLLDRVRSDARLETVWADEELTTSAIDRWLRPFADQRFRLCDAVSFEVMRRRRIRRAVALDRHFAVAGFEAL